MERQRRPEPPQVIDRGAPAVWRGAVAGLLAVAVVVGALGWATAGFATVTAEGARRRAIRRTPVVIPAAPAVTPEGQTVDVLAETGGSTIRNTPRVAIVAFFYSRCPGICGRLGESLQRVQQLVAARGVHDAVRVIAVSFDPASDTPDQLRRYAGLRRVDPSIWQLRTLDAGAPSVALLRAFGVTVISDGAGGFQHNAALHIVLPDRRLVRVLDLDDAEGAIAIALDALGVGPVAQR
jgi:protein SCO1